MPKTEKPKGGVKRKDKPKKTITKNTNNKKDKKTKTTNGGAAATTKKQTEKKHDPKRSARKKTSKSTGKMKKLKHPTKKEVVMLPKGKSLFIRLTNGYYCELCNKQHEIVGSYYCDDCSVDHPALGDPHNVFKSHVRFAHGVKKLCPWCKKTFEKFKIEIGETNPPQELEVCPHCETDLWSFEDKELIIVSQ